MLGHLSMYVKVFIVFHIVFILRHDQLLIVYSVQSIRDCQNTLSMRASLDFPLFGTDHAQKRFRLIFWGERSRVRKGLGQAVARTGQVFQGPVRARRPILARLCACKLARPGPGRKSAARRPSGQNGPSKMF